MKKIFYYLMSAVVAFGAMACQNDVEENVTPGEGGNGEKVSFVAEIGDVTRVAIGDKVDGKGYPITLEADDVLSLRAYDQGEETWGDPYIFTTTDGKNFSCEAAGVSELIGKQVRIHNGDGNDTYCSLCGIKGINISTVVDPFEANSTITLEVAHAVLMFESEYDVTFNTTTDGIFSITTDCPNKDVNDVQDSITISASEGVHYIAVNGGKETTLSYSIEGVKCKEITITFEPGKLYNLGTLDKPSAWSVVGEFNSWDQTANQMYLEGNAFVARNITFDASGLKLCYNNWENEVGVYQEYGKELDPVTVGDWYLSKYKTDGYKSNITVTDMTKKYDIYLLNDTTHAYFCVVESGAKVTVPSGGWGICGSFTGWGEQQDIKLTKEGDKYVATDVEIPAGAEFKFRYNNIWDLDQKGLSEEDSATAITVGEAVDVTGNQNIKVATAGTYDIYLTADFSVFAVVNAGAGYPVEPFKIYVYNYAEWSPLNIYAWTTGNVSAAWPGDAITKTEDINGYTYNVYTIPVGANDKTLNIIFNNGSMQTPDYKLGVVNKDYYLRLEGPFAPVVIEDINNPEPEVVVEKVARTITVKDNTGSTSLNLYWWTGGTGWPGDKMTKNGTTYTYTFDKSLDGMTVNMIFNNGSGGQTADITNIKLDKDYTFTLNNDWSYTQN